MLRNTILSGVLSQIRLLPVVKKPWSNTVSCNLCFQCLRGRPFAPRPSRQSAHYTAACNGGNMPADSSFRKENFYERILKNYRSQDTGRISIDNLETAVKDAGLQPTDPRLRSMFEKLRIVDSKFSESGCTGDEYYRLHFQEAISSNILLLEKALNGKLIIPDFKPFLNKIDKFYYDCIEITGGENVPYIPALKNVKSDIWGVSLCTVDGQRHWVGDSSARFTMQSGNKCFTYAVAVDKYGSESIHQHIGMEPSGTNFNTLQLSSHGKPHNPMINSGALLLCSLFKPEWSAKERSDFILQKFSHMTGKESEFMQCDMEVYESEMETAHMNTAILHHMKHMGVFQGDVVLEDILEVYTRLCSTRIDCSRGAVMAATLANAGQCPTTGEEVLSSEAVRDTLALMQSCGMYDHSGEFSFHVGLPAKSGVSGVIFVVVPNIMGLCLYSPPLNKYGHSVRGMEFCKKLVSTFNFHNCDGLLRKTSKIDPRRKVGDQKAVETTGLMYATKAGSLSSIQRYLMMEWIDPSQQNYDNRTTLHLAAAEGHYDIVDFLSDKVPVNSLDRWSRTPLDDAKTFKHQKVIDLLCSRGGKSGNDIKSETAK